MSLQPTPNRPVLRLRDSCVLEALRDVSDLSEKILLQLYDLPPQRPPQGDTGSATAQPA
jgi:hypothetical protein